MFEQELELEKKTSTVIPLLLIVGLIVAIASVSVYFVLQNRKVLSTAEVSPVIQSNIDNLGPVTLTIATGDLKPEVGQRSTDPHFRLLEKAGYLKLGKEEHGKTPVAWTSNGETWLAGIPGVKKSTNADKNTEYVIPLADRKIVTIGKITMLNPNKATVEYTWKWETTKAGELFDASGPAVKAFNTWDRSTLIDKYGANFYHSEPTKVLIMVANTQKGWQLSTE